jgi:hypothetical protein
MAKKGNLQGTTKTSKVFVSIGVVPARKKKGTKEVTEAYERFLVMTEEQALFVGVPFKRFPPAPITVKRRDGKTFTREVATTITKVRYRLGYVLPPKRIDGRLFPNIKWVPLHIPKGLDLSSVLKIVRGKFNKKPTYFQTDGSTTQFVNVK